MEVETIDCHEENLGECIKKWLEEIQRCRGPIHIKHTDTIRKRLDRVIYVIYYE